MRTRIRHIWRDDFNRWSAIYLTMAGGVVFWLIWHDCHLPNCIAIYGVGSAHDSVDAFLDCSDGNVAEAFRVQFIAILGIFGSMLVAGAVNWLIGRVVSGENGK